MSGIAIITADALADELQEGRVNYLWNALSDSYFTGELIPGSTWVPVDHVGRDAAALGVAKDAQIVVYCSGPSCPNSRQAAEKLVKLGYTGVRLFEGGLEEWKASGRKTHMVERTPV